MMFYFYTILIPVIIIIILWLIVKPKEYVNFLLLLVGILFIYSAILYVFEMNHTITAGWVSYTLIFFLVSTLIILLIIKLIKFFKK